MGRLQRQHLAHGAERLLPLAFAVLRVGQSIEERVAARMRPRRRREELLGLGRLPRAVESLQERQRHALVLGLLGEEGPHPPQRFLHVACAPVRQRGLHARIERQGIGRHAEQLGRGRLAAGGAQPLLHLLEGQRALPCMTALHQRHRPVEEQLRMIGIESQRAVQRVLGLRAAPRAEQRNRHAQERSRQLAPFVLVRSAGAVPRIQLAREPEQLARVRADRLQIALLQRQPRQRRQHLRRLGALREQAQEQLARLGVLALRLEERRLRRESLGIRRLRRPRLGERALRPRLVVALDEGARHVDPRARRLIAQPIGDDQGGAALLVAHLFALLLARPLLRGAARGGELDRDRLGGGEVGERQLEAHQLAVGVRVLRIPLDGRAQVRARLHRTIARLGDARQHRLCRSVRGVDGEGGAQLLLRIRDAALLEQHAGELGVQVRRFGIVEQRLAQLGGGCGVVVCALGEQRIEVVPVGARADVALRLERIGGLPHRLDIDRRLRLRGGGGRFRSMRAGNQEQQQREA